MDGGSCHAGEHAVIIDFESHRDRHCETDTASNYGDFHISDPRVVAHPRIVTTACKEAIAVETVTVPTPTVSDAEMIEGYLASLRWGNLSPNTVTIRDSYLKKLSRELGPFGSIKPAVLQAWLGDEDRKLSPSTISLYMTTFSGFFDYCRKQKFVQKNPLKKIEKPKANDLEHYPIPDEDLDRAFGIADRHMSAVIALGAYAGCRAQEIALMCREDIHDDESMRVHIVNGKGRKQRWVPLTPDLLEVLNAWGLPESGRLWMYNPQQLSRAVNDFLHDEVHTDSTCHSLRHFYATKVYQETHDIRMVQMLLGHASIATTQRYAKADMTGAADAVMRAFAPKIVEPLEEAA